ncbi:OprO/OprP family phosphate-selective porin [Flavobacterium agricola]|uniref:OprO/OprP family phosphate-selective porin n=1 Tax=Flavobacterium agricola TaxID=2870839 RepID=A0ABY6LXM4_9FLAO|nr:OprO/OprP family phosphate-selective porin [Flavobacterium agricola]UYW01085.1 OprO/OprP family phosphate-selective porin [Flavobacterium agricola]
MQVFTNWKKLCSAAVLFFAASSLQAQDTIYVVQQIVNTKTETTKSEYPKFKIGGVFQARYLESVKRDVDVDGLNHTEGKYLKSTYDVKRMRVSMNANLTQNLSVVALANFADFKSDPRTRVLENAYARYAVSRYVQLQIGQFRPSFGMEDSYPVDIVKSIDYSNAYYLMGSNGWQSFQIGAAVGGSVDLGKVPLTYSVSMTNGNGKNTVDNNNGKHYSGRFVFDLNKKNNFRLGFSAGAGNEFGKDIYALGLEGTYQMKLTERWSFDIQTEAIQAINQSLYFSLPEADRLDNINNYVLKGIYALPSFRYYVGKKHFQALEFSFRYEYLEANSKLNSNPRQTYVPMLSLEFLKNYGARIQIGAQIDNYRKNIANTKTYNANLAFVQFQCRLQ